MSSPPSSPRKLTEQNLVAKWTRPVYERGWTAVPTPMLDLPALGLRPLTFVVLVQLISFWWEPDKKPFPSRARLAERLGVSVRTVHRAIGELEDMGLIESRPRTHASGANASNEYDLSGLVRRLRHTRRNV